MPIDGKIKIKVTVSSSVIKSIFITSSRPTHITQLFTEQSIQKVATTIDALYQLCNIAHRFAFLRLLDKCKVISLSKNEIMAYQLLLDLETIKEHCFSIATKWCINDNQIINKNIIELLATIKKINSSLFSSDNTLSLNKKTIQSFSIIKPLIEKLEQQLTIAIIGNEFDAKTIFDNSSNFKHWIETKNSDCAIFLHNIQKYQFGDMGNINANFLPNTVIKKLTNLLNNDNFISQPSYKDSCYETTPYARQSNHPLIQQLFDKYGSGVFTRASAQLLEIFELLKRIKTNYTQIHNEDIYYKINTSANATAMVNIDAARGKLIHRLSIQGEKIKTYRILSPTQWNFHPQGVLKQMIKLIYFKDKQDLNDKIKLLVNAIDPCVGYVIEIDYA
ncbi:Hydrogenase maturation factor HoxV/HupK [hydrothermal vent metagenome]|uniref:Hydrogenase maturation factor HoxV/HupK n=1 Tax=hydrothermal vent metagenome TaxID=652676 RepID=A0A1W1BZC3_9ZZZZ